MQRLLLGVLLAALPFAFSSADEFGQAPPLLSPRRPQLAPQLQQRAQPQPTLAERLGYSADDKLLIVHGDDLGLAHSVNKASIDALETGLLNSASVMVPCAWFPEIAAYARNNPEADLGLHLTLTSEWKHYRWDSVMPRHLVPSLHDEKGFLHATTGEAAQKIAPADAEAEIRAQVERALAFGLKPTHLDSHMGTLFQNPALFEVYLRVGRAYKLPVMLPRESLEAPQAKALMDLIQPDDLLIDRILILNPEAGDADAFYSSAIQNLKPGVTELIVHLGYDDAELQAVTVDHPDFGSEWRQADFDYVTSDRFRNLVAANDVKLVTWRQIGTLIRQ